MISSKQVQGYQKQQSSDSRSREQVHEQHKQQTIPTRAAAINTQVKEASVTAAATKGNTRRSSKFRNSRHSTASSRLSRRHGVWNSILRMVEVCTDKSPHV